MKKSEKLSPLNKKGNLTGQVRKVTRQGKRSLAITIPSEIVDELKIRERQKMVFKVEHKKIIITDWK